MSELVLTLRQPAQLGSKARSDNVLGTMEHIPGSAVRGALAAAWLARNGISKPGTPEREEFLRLFEGGVRYGSLLRDGTEFMSLAVVGHKYHPQDNCEVIDYDRALGEEPPPECPQCTSPIEQRKGLKGKRKAPRRRTSVAIGGDGTAIDGALFTRETLEAGETFRGTVAASDDALLKILGDLGPVRIGGRRTTHGLADIAIEPGTAPPLPECHDGMIIVRLRSPGIFVDDRGRPADRPSESELEQALGGTGARVEKAWTRWEQVGGWHAASGLPKPQELAVAAGSSYVISTERPVDHAALSALADRGLGLRRHEGFGDLAPAPALRPGAKALREEADRQKKLKDKTAPLLRITILAEPEREKRVRALMKAHADGDPQAAARLRDEAARQGDADVRTAMESFFGLPSQDRAYLARELGR